MIFRSSKLSICILALVAAAVIALAVPIEVRAQEGSFFKPQAPAQLPPSAKRKGQPKRETNGHSLSPATRTEKSETTSSTSAQIVGRVDNITDEMIFVNGKAVRLEGMTEVLFPPELITAFKAWIARNGGTVTCTRSQKEDDAYVCVTPSKLNLSLALAINGAMGDEASTYGVAFIATNAKAEALKDDPAFAQFLAGNVNLDCNFPFSCGAKIAFGGYDNDNALYDKADWVGLAKSVIGIGFRSDIQYFYLGRAAEGLLDYPAAQKYYQRAYELHAHGELTDHCAGVSVNIACNSINLGQELISRLESVRDMVPYNFQ